METSHHGLYIHTGNGGNTGGNATEVTSGGRGGDVHLVHSHSTTNYVSNIYYISPHNSTTLITDTQPRSGIYIFCRYGPFELRIELVARVFPLVIRINYDF
ncbi:hypothetical protein BS47DRAFT_562247 [Hydnum rufescens UP504]|uniref:Uncharacterized protein n=1 Tax=Hydnum rufescens UP504 TaxID=1448309 RepID=A0A9P6DP33_9AGAM|nr:hypothetical protein BS47DRAFT_562247 [Hydnum rufescens UP504]